MSPLVDAYCMELISTARPTPHSTELRRSRGFPGEAYQACVQRVVTLYENVVEMLVREEMMDGLEEVVEHHSLPPAMAQRMYVMALSTRFDREQVE